MVGWLFVVMLAVQAPAQHADDDAAAQSVSQPAPATLPAGFPIDPTPPAPEEVADLPPELALQLRDAVLPRPGSPSTRLQRLVDFMFSPEGLGLAYQEDATYTVAQAMQARRGNCVTFTLMFLAMAQEAGLVAWPQESEDVLAWHLLDSLLYRANHVSAAVRIGAQTWRVDATPEPVIARAPPQRIDRARLLSHYYNNLAVALMAQGRLGDATRYMDAALAQDPGNAATWSNAGVLALRGGDRAAARVRYVHALALAPRQSSALFNMVALLDHHDPRGELPGYRERLERVQRQDPLHHFMLGMELEGRGDLADAISHLRRATRLSPREFRFHLALARAYREAGDTRRAERALARARALGGEAAVESALPPLMRTRGMAAERSPH